MTIYDFELEDNQGKKVSLRDFRGKVLLIVNTATRCGFTPQYIRKRDWHYKENPDIKWNFTKFLVDRQGRVVGRFEPTESMEFLEGQLLSCLKEVQKEA